MKITASMVKDNYVFFQYYRDGMLWYLLRYTDGFAGNIKEFLFPVPVEDTGSATFEAQDKAIIFMRWMNKHAKNIEAQNNEA